LLLLELLLKLRELVLLMLQGLVVVALLPLLWLLLLLELLLRQQPMLGLLQRRCRIKQPQSHEHV